MSEPDDNISRTDSNKLITLETFSEHSDYLSGDPSSPPVDYTSKIRVPTTNTEKKFVSRALDFLTNIQTKPSHRTPLQSQAESPDLSQENKQGKFSEPMTYYQPFMVRYSPVANSSLVDLSSYPSTLRSGQLKEMENERFRQQYPQLDPRLTLSKIVNLREDFIRKICIEHDIEAYVVAIGWTYFMKLLTQNKITRANRKLYCAVCVLLAYKFYEETHLEEAKFKLDMLKSAIFGMDPFDQLTNKDLQNMEFQVYAQLEFSLLINDKDIEVNFLQILQRMQVAPDSYLGQALERSGLLIQSRSSSSFGNTFTRVPTKAQRMNEDNWA